MPFRLPSGLPFHSSACCWQVSVEVLRKVHEEAEARDAGVLFLGGTLKSELAISPVAELKALANPTLAALLHAPRMTRVVSFPRNTAR